MYTIAQSNLEILVVHQLLRSILAITFMGAIFSPARRIVHPISVSSMRNHQGAEPGSFLDPSRFVVGTEDPLHYRDHLA